MRFNSGFKGLISLIPRPLLMTSGRIGHWYYLYPVK